MLSQRKFEIGEGIQDFNQMESYLGRALAPISPRKEFVDNLRGRLANSPQSNTRGLSTIEYLFFATAGLVSSLLLLIASIRACLALIGALKYLRHPRNSIDKSGPVSLI